MALWPALYVVQHVAEKASILLRTRVLVNKTIYRHAVWEHCSSALQHILVPIEER
jgi:hypothetical protein